MIFLLWHKTNIVLLKTKSNEKHFQLYRKSISFILQIGYMEYIKVLVFISYISCSVNNVSMQGYVRLAEVPSFQIHCKETPVSSLLQCAALARASKDVRFFFNLKESYCRWSCTFLYTGSTVMTDQWQQYGMFLFNLYFVLFHVLFIVNLTYSCFLKAHYHMWLDFFVCAFQYFSM